MQTIATIVSWIGSDWFALLFALLVPWMIIYATHEIRFRRLRLIMDYEVSFASKPGTGNNPSFEFVKSKYISDIKGSEIPKLQPGGTRPFTSETDARIFALLSSPPRFFSLSTNWRLLSAAVGFAILTFFGFAVSLSNIRCIAGQSECAATMQNVVFVGGSGLSEAQSAKFAEQILTVASLAFLGGYISAVREFLRRMALFDLSSYTFLKQAAEILASVLAVVFLYRAIPDPLQQVTSMWTEKSWEVSSSVPLIWLAIAPLFGLFPESATRYLFVRARSIFNWIKSEDNRFAEVTRATPLDVIDGIDYWIRIRLEQCGIFDVQNLATYNPIMLYIETPYGIYQVFDWIAQAQLCHIVGLEKFLALREVNVRTIFDLERSIRSRKSPDQYDDVFAAILFAPTCSMKLVSSIAEMKFLIRKNSTPELVDYQQYCVWLRSTIAPNDGTNSQAIEHLLSWVSDDLHVRRLRRLFSEISMSLGPSSLRLPDDKEIEIAAQCIGERDVAAADHAADPAEPLNDQVGAAKAAE